MYQVNDPGYSLQFTTVSTQLWFGGKKLAVRDRLGSNGAYYPYGEERTGSVQNADSFATYKRDKGSGLDYADQRYYSATFGRFMTPDPYQASGGVGNPSSWNRYAYVEGDPVNFGDKQGLMEEAPDNEGRPTFSVTVTGVAPADYIEVVGWLTRSISLKSEWDRNSRLFATPEKRGKRVAGLVAKKTVSDCYGLSLFADAVAQDLAAQGGTDATFVQSFGEFVDSENLFVKMTQSMGVAISSRTKPTLLNPDGAPSGFAAGMQDSNVINGDQAHHFAAFFQLGYTLGSDLSKLAAYIHDAGIEFNPGDIALGIGAAQLGERVRNGFSLGDMGREIEIRTTICDH